MSMDDSRTEDRETLRRAAAATPRCIPLERFGEPLGDADRAHVAQCARCQTELALWAEFETPVPAAEDRLPVEWITGEVRRRRDRAARPATWGWSLVHRRSLLAAAAGVVLVVSLGYLAWDREPGLHAPDASAPAYRSSRVEVIAPVGDVAEAPAGFSWRPVAGAVDYEIVVTEVDRTVLWRESSSVPRVATPAALATRFVPGKTIFWDITAQDASGQVIARSGTTRFRVALASRGDSHGP